MVAVVVMGVCGCGKSTIAKAIARELAGTFIEGDGLHPKANVDKMASGIPLCDEDRWPWLTKIGETLSEEASKGVAIAACSALKKSYRDRIKAAAGREVLFVFLQGDKALIKSRMSKREGHYMPTSLIDSQFAILEDPSDESGVLAISIDDSPEKVASKALVWLVDKNE